MKSRSHWLLAAVATSLLTSSPLLAVAIEVGSVTLGNTNGTTGHRTVTFPSSVFDEADVTPLVFVLPTTQGSQPCSFQLNNITQTSFDIACVEPPGENGPHIAMTLHYIAIEAGVHTVPATIGGSSTNVVFAAGSTATTAVQHNCASGCGSTGSTSISFGTTFSNPPALLLQVQTDNSESGSPPGGVSQPFLTEAILENGSGNPDITTTGANIALERSEVNLGTVSSETIGWLAVDETLSGGSAACATLDFSSFGGPSSVAFQAVITGEVIDGWDDGCSTGEGASFVTGCFSSAPIVGATKRGRNGTDGGWLRRCTGGFTSTTVLFTVDEDRHRDSERNHTDEAASVLAFETDFSTPVTLAYFRAERMAGGTRFEWETETEAGNLGFDLSYRNGAGWERINDRLIPSPVVDSTTPQRYEYEAPGVYGHQFRLTDIDTRGVRKDHGPFGLEADHGARVPRRVIDWRTVRSRSATRERPSRRTESGSADTASTTTRRRQRSNPTGLPAARELVAELRLSEAGLYRVGYRDLKAAGVDLAGMPARGLALTRSGQPQRIRVAGARSGRIGPGTSIAFYGRPESDSLYTTTSVYRLWLGPERPLRVRRDPNGARIDSRLEPATTYRASVEVEHDRFYSFASPNGDPWYDVRLLAYDQAVGHDFPVELDRIASGGASARLDLGLWGVTDFPLAPDHHAVAYFNGEPLWDETFDGLVDVDAQVELPAALLQEGTNTLRLELPADTGASYDLINFDRFSVTYERELFAGDGRLDFTGRAALFEVSGLPSRNTVVYRFDRRRRDQLWHRVPFAASLDDDGWKIRFRGRRHVDDRYLVWPKREALSPDEVRAASAPQLDSGAVDFVLISHADFVEGLAPLVEARQARGIRTRVVDVDQLYAAYSHGVVDPEAIRRYLAWAHEELGARYALLVGADTYDYFDYTGTGSMSFVPTPYASTGPIVSFAPADPLLADVDGDRLPDLAIGRFPVRTVQELAFVVDKTLAYERSRGKGTAIFAADGDERSASFTQLSEHLLEQLPTGWQVERAHLSQTPLSEARQLLIDRLEAGAALTNFVGHSGPSRWTFDGLFSSGDAAALTNQDPTVVVQWGCWNTYHVDPAFDTLAHRFLTSGPHGAAAVVGASTLTDLHSEQQLGPRVLSRAAQPGVLLGDAIQQAKSDLAAEHPEMLDVILGWTLLGDPTLSLW